MSDVTNEDDEIPSISEENVAPETDTLIAEEEIPIDDEVKPAKKRIAALRARHKLEDYFEEKKLVKTLDYLQEGVKKRSKKQARKDVAA